MGGNRFKDFISKTDSFKVRENIFFDELGQSIKNKENIALVAIIQNPRATTYPWFVYGAYDLNVENLEEGGGYSTIEEAASNAYRFAKKFQIEKGLFTRFISLKNKREDDEDDED